MPQPQYAFPEPQLYPTGGMTEELESTASHNRRESNGYNYENPYQEHRPGSSSIGPWDSASQRSEVASTMHHNYSLPLPTAAPLSGAPSHIKNVGSFAPSMGGLSYIDEEGAYYRSESRRPASMLLSNEGKGDDLEMRGLVGGAGPMGGIYEEDQEGGRRKVHFPQYEESPNPYPPYQGNEKDQWKEPSALYENILFPLGLDRLLALFGSSAGKFPLEQAIERKRRGIGGQRWPIATYTLVVGED